MIDEKDLDQPWIPEGAWMPRIGERVRVRLSGECRHQWGEGYCDPDGHFDFEDGLTGTVISPDGRPHHAGHPIWVGWDTAHRVSLPQGNLLLMGCPYALAELEPVDATP